MDESRWLIGPINMFKKKTLRQMRVPELKDKTPAPVQISAEQLIADPDLGMMGDIKLPMRDIMSHDELEDYKKNKRNEFETKVRRYKYQIGNWIKYAEWEFNLKEYR